MNIDWDQFPADQMTEAAAPLSREPLSEGIHCGKIDRVTVESGWRVSADNPSGDCLSIWLDCEENGERADVRRVFVTVPCNQINRISVIARACGVAPPERGRADWDETTLIGRGCEVETSQYIVQNGPKAGETRASVKRWIVPEAAKPAAPAPAPQTVAPKPAAKVPAMKVNKAAKAAQGGADDIPF